MPQDWKKLLWLKQDYLDNYTDKTFLSQLKRNTTVATYSYKNLVRDFSLVVLHISTISLVLLTFVCIHSKGVNPIVPTAISSALTVIGFVIYFAFVQPAGHQTLTVLKSSIFIILILLSLSPVLKSLTNSTSEDSIWALSVWLCILHVVFNDYSLNVNSSLSKTISLSNAIVLASRLASNLSAFCFILFSLQVNGLFPIFNNACRRDALWKFHWLQMAGVLGSVYVILYHLWGVRPLLLFIALHILIALLGPVYFIALQKYKDELQGPWDPAKPVVKTA